jgi:uncharacterized protein
MRDIALAPERRQITTAPLDLDEVRDSRAGEGQWDFVGHAAVFNQWTTLLRFHDGTVLRERIAPAFFDDVLSRDPDVHFVWDHDTRWTLARTRSKTLELGTNARGLRTWARVAPTTYAADLRVLMERGDIDQMSFMFTVAADTWEVDEEENISRTLVACDELYDVTVCARGAYPQTDAQIAGRALAHAPDDITELLARRIPGWPGKETPDEAPAIGKPDEAPAIGADKQRSKLAARVRAELDLARAKTPKE